MRIICSLVCSATFLIGCGGSNGGSSASDSYLSGRYAGTLRGVSCASGQTAQIDVRHDVDVSEPSNDKPVAVVDREGQFYNGSFIVVVRPEGNVYGFNVRRDADEASNLPLAFSYNFAGLPEGVVDVVGFSRRSLTGECGEFSGQLERVSDE